MAWANNNLLMVMVMMMVATISLLFQIMSQSPIEIDRKNQVSYLIVVVFLVVYSGRYFSDTRMWMSNIKLVKKETKWLKKQLLKVTPEAWINIAAPVRDAIIVLHKVADTNVDKIFTIIEEIRSINK